MRAPGPASPLYQTFGWSLFSCLPPEGGSAGVWKPEAARRRSHTQTSKTFRHVPGSAGRLECGLPLGDDRLPGSQNPRL